MKIIYIYAVSCLAMIACVTDADEGTRSDERSDTPATVFRVDQDQEVTYEHKLTDRNFQASIVNLVGDDCPFGFRVTVTNDGKYDVEAQWIAPDTLNSYSFDNATILKGSEELVVVAPGETKEFTIFVGTRLVTALNHGQAGLYIAAPDLQGKSQESVSLTLKGENYYCAAEVHSENSENSGFSAVQAEFCQAVEAGTGFKIDIVTEKEVCTR